MNCDYTAKVSSLIDGELSQPEADRIREHIRTCHTCWQGLEDFLHLRREIKAYEFAPDLITQRQALRKILAADQPTHPSTRLRERLTGAFTAPRFSPALTTALILIAIGITVGVMRYAGSLEDGSVHQIASQSKGNSSSQRLPEALPEPDGSTTSEKFTKPSTEIKAENDAPPQVASRDSKDGRSKGLPTSERRIVKRVSEQPRTVIGTKTPQELVREAEQNYQAAIAMLARNVNRSQIDPKALARFEETLASIDQAIADTRRAVRANPDDPVVVQYMLSAYAKKIEVLEEMTAERRTP